MTSTMKIIISSIVVITITLIAYWFVAPKAVTLPTQPTSDSTAGSIPEVEPVAAVPSIKDSPIKLNDYPDRTTAELNDAIIKAAPESLKTANGQISFVFVASVSPQKGWYVVTVRASTSGTSDTKKVILKDNGIAAGGLVLVAGPSSVFPDNINLPVQVRISLS